MDWLKQTFIDWVLWLAGKLAVVASVASNAIIGIVGRWFKVILATLTAGVAGFTGWAFGFFDGLLENVPDFDLSWLAPFIDVADTIVDVQIVGTALATWISMRVLGFNFFFTWLTLRFFKKGSGNYSEGN